MNRKILDTNVIIHANGNKSPQTSQQCIELCFRLLYRCMAEKFQIVIDAGEHGSDVLREYQNNLQYYSGGAGEIFLQWLLNNIGDTKHVFQVPITRSDEDEYDEFPKDSKLKDFDPRDRKFVALAAAHYTYEDDVAPIVQSADIKWMKFVSVFKKYHVEIDFICEDKST